MKCFKYLIQQFENLITFCRMIVWWTLVFVIAPGWAGESKSVPPQSNPVSTACKQIDDNVVEEWKKKVKNFQESLPKMATRGGLDDISSPLFFPITSSKVVKILSGQRKIHLAWESGEKPYRVKVSLNGDIWFEEPDLQETKVSLVENKEFKASENHRFAVIDSNDNDGKWKFTVVDQQASQPFVILLDQIQKESSDQSKDKTAEERKKAETAEERKKAEDELNKKRWRFVVLLLSYGEEWKLEAYQQIAEQPYQKETDEFYWAWLGIKYQIWPICQEGAKK